MVSSKTKLTEHIYEYVDSILQPLLHNIGGLTTDTNDIHRRHNDIIHLVAPESYMLTMDDTSLYVNIPHTDVSMHAAHFLAGTQLIQLS